MCSFLRKVKQGSKFLQTLPLLGVILVGNRYQCLNFLEGKPPGRPSSHMYQFPARHLRHSLPPPLGVDSHLPVLSQMYQEISGQDWDRIADKSTGNLFLGNLFYDLFCFAFLSYFEIKSIRSDEGLMLETSASESLYGGQFTLSTQLITPNYLVILPPTQHHSFFRNLPPLFD